MNLFTGNIFSRTFPDFVNVRTFPGPGKWICYFPGNVDTLYNAFIFLWTVGESVNWVNHLFIWSDWNQFHVFIHITLPDQSNIACEKIKKLFTWRQKETVIDVNFWISIPCFIIMTVTIMAMLINSNWHGNNIGLLGIVLIISVQLQRKMNSLPWQETCVEILNGSGGSLKKNPKDGKS